MSVKRGHFAAHVVDPDALGVAGVRFATGEEIHVGLYALGIEDAGGQTEDSVEIAFVQEVRYNRRGGTALQALALR
jgi:hypothetical protein